MAVIELNYAGYRWVAEALEDGLSATGATAGEALRNLAAEIDELPPFQAVKKLRDLLANEEDTNGSTR
jgi:hypothetical protein